MGNPLTFTEEQNRMITRTLTLMSVLALGVMLVFCFWLLFRGLACFIHVVGPVIVGVFLSLLTKPWFMWLKNKLHNQAFSIIIFVLSFALPLALVVYLFGQLIAEQGGNLLRSLPDMLTKIQTTWLNNSPDSQPIITAVIAKFKEFLTAGGEVNWVTVRQVSERGLLYGGEIFSWGGVIAMWMITPIYWLVFVSSPKVEGAKLATYLPFLDASTQTAMGRRIDTFFDLLISYFRGQFIDVTIQALLYGTIFQLIGLPSGFIIGFLMGFLNLAPYIGVTVGLAIALPIAFFSSGLGLMLAVLGIFCTIQTLDGYGLQPWIQGDRMQLKMWQIVFALLFWTQLGGFLGLLLAIPVTAFIRTIWDSFVEYSRTLVPHQSQAGACALEDHHA